MTSPEEHRAEIDRRSDDIRDQIEAGEWQLVRQFLAGAPEAQQREFYLQCIRVMLSRGAEFMSGPMRTVAAPLQEAVALGIAERVDMEMQGLRAAVGRVQLPGKALPLRIEFDVANTESKT